MSDHVNDFILTQPDGQGRLIFHCGATEIMRLDDQGMTYKGQRIDDAGEAHRAFLEVMALMRKDYI